MARRATTRAVARAAQTGLRIAIYTRRSTDEEHQPFSLEAQTTRLHAYITSQPDWTSVATFTDDASGATLDRPGLADALAAARAGQYDILLVYRVDRFTRRIRDLSYLIEELDKAGVAFRSATEPFDTATPAGRMMVQMLAVFAEFERALIIDRVINGMERKAAKGRWTLGTAPYGYRIDPDEHVLLPVEDEAVIVKEIFHLYTYRRLGTRAIANRLNARGLRRRSGRPWSHKTVADVLVNRVYLGEVWFRDIVATEAHEALVQPNTFALADRILIERGENPAKKAAATTDYHVSGKITCPRCEHTYLGTNATGRHRVYRYYTCATRSRYGVDHCPAPRIDADGLDHDILDALCTFYTSNLDLLGEALAAALADYRSTKDSYQQELAALSAQLAVKDTAIDRYLADFETTKISEAVVARRVDQLSAEIRQLRNRHDELTFLLDADSGEPNPNHLAEVPDRLTEIVTGADAPLRRALCEALIAELRLGVDETATPVFAAPDGGAALKIRP
ncbi:recombinase family protein [Actinomycetes bacterium KLBMP 9797]